jgi:hypothetical protein
MIYLASPYTHPDEGVRKWRFHEACRAAAALLRAGVTVFSPIAHSHPISRFGMPTSREFWSQIDREYLSRCDVLAVLTLAGWRESVGVQGEIELAREMGIPVVYVSPTELNADDRDPPTLDELAQRQLSAGQRVT